MKREALYSRCSRWRASKTKQGEKKLTKEQKDGIKEMSSIGGGSCEGGLGKPKEEDEELLEEKEEELLKEYIRRLVFQEHQERKLFKELIQKIILVEKQKDKEFSQHFGINILNHEVLSQIVDDIQMKTKSLGDNESLVDSFKRYVFLFLKDLFNVEIDENDINNEIGQIKQKQQLNEIVNNRNYRISLNYDPEEESSPIDSAALPGSDEEVDPEGERLSQIQDVPTAELEEPSDRTLKRGAMELEQGGLEDSKQQALDLLNQIDDIIIKALSKISNEENRDLFMRYCIISVRLHLNCRRHIRIR